MVYQEKYCDRCVNWKDLGDGRGFGCPIWDMHQVLNYDRVKTPMIAHVLDSFIPMDKAGVYPIECLMFNQAEGEIEGQLHFKEVK
jgi:hypothetical protein